MNANFEQRREAVAGEHRAEAERASARPPRPSSGRGSRSAKPRPSGAGALHEERAGLHEKGMADHELIDDSERENFAGTSADVE